MSKINEAGEGQFVEHLPDAQEVPGPRAEFRRDIELAHIRTRDKPKRRPEIVLDLLPVHAHIPQIIRVTNAEAERIILPLQPFRLRLEEKSVNAEVLILPQEVTAEEPEVSTERSTGDGPGRIAVSEDTTHV